MSLEDFILKCGSNVELLLNVDSSKMSICAYELAKESFYEKNKYREIENISLGSDEYTFEPYIILILK